MELKNFLTEDYLKRFKVYKSTSLFEPDAWDLTYWLKQMRCPLCQRKLYWNIDKSIARCKSKVKDKFFIKGETLQDYLKLK